MSTIVELAAKLGLAPAAAGNPGAYATYLASLIVEFGAGGALFVILALRFGRSLSRWVGSWSVGPEHLFKLAIPVACLVTSAGLLALDIRYARHGHGVGAAFKTPSTQVVNARALALGRRPAG